MKSSRLKEDKDLSLIGMAIPLMAADYDIQRTSPPTSLTLECPTTQTIYQILHEVLVIVDEDYAVMMADDKNEASSKKP